MPPDTRQCHIKSDGCPIRRRPPTWTTENRCRYDRSQLRYPSDLTDAEWALLKPVIPRAKRGAASVRSTFAKWSTG